MRCKRHPYENGVGVCAPCLRERLLALLADQPDDQRDHPRNPELPSPPPPLQCPRSVSPYISHRRSADPAAPAPCRLSRLFYSTPQIGPAAACSGACRKRGSGKSSLLASLFGHSRSEKADHDHGFSEAPWSSSWLSVLLHGHRKKKNSRLFAAEEEAARRSCRGRDRGLSPETDCSASGDERAVESPGWWWRPTPSPMRRPAAAAHHHHHRVGGLAGFAICLSPLVRASPSHRRSQTAAEVGFSDDLRSTPNRRHRRHVSGLATSLGPNQSRKLADFGRFR
uniref:Uncharacterized protein LOC105043819 n=1 Tax=Elaeis guineensis var. tenera TaxID=51953 RepID=A0A6I9R3I6_ELAGV|nr:uncharacterized protein LOC105043819 [Elaeis guineensis]